MSQTVVKATLLAILSLSANGAAHADTDMASMGKPAKGMERCYGIVKAGMNDCAYAKQSCAGSSTADGEKGAWIDIPKGLCHKIVGSSLIPPTIDTDKKA